MVTADIFEKLKELQDVLVQKYELEAKVEEAPKQLSAQDELLARLKKEYIAKNTNYESVKDKVLALRFDLDQAVKLREDGEKGMENVETHREYEALGKQIAEATDKENEVRKELQKEEKILAELNETLKMNEEMIKAQENELSESKQSLDQQIQEYNAQLSELKTKEDQITPELPQEIIFKFERIIQRNSEGIVSVKNGVCTGCHMILPAQFANTVREGEEILFCPYCSRILFYEDSEEAAEDYFKIDDSFDDVFDDETDEEGYDDDEERDDDYYGSDDDSDLDDESEDDEDSDDDEDSED
jgi:predicted  nucleic acid-binding Zn-ribbon protein